MQKLYSTPRAIAYLERHPDAVFEWTDPTPGIGGLRRLCRIGANDHDWIIYCPHDSGVWLQRVPHAAQWRLVSLKPKRERVRLGGIEFDYKNHRLRIDDDRAAINERLLDLPEGKWTVYAVKVER